MPLPTIKNRRDFLAVSANGKKFITTRFIVQYRKRPDDHPVRDIARVGFTVTKRLGNAVSRNRIRRRLKEAVRLLALPQLAPGHDYVVIAREGAKLSDFSAIARDVTFAFSRIHAK